MTTNFKQARMVIAALIEGIDPTTGEDLPKDTILHRSEVIRALLIAKGACDSMEARATRRAQLPESVGKGWTQDEEATLTMEFRNGLNVADAAKAHGRTVRAIEARLEKLGLITPDQRTVQSGFIHVKPDDKA